MAKIAGYDSIKCLAYCIVLKQVGLWDYKTAVQTGGKNGHKVSLGYLFFCWDSKHSFFVNLSKGSWSLQYISPEEIKQSGSLST